MPPFIVSLLASPAARKAALIGAACLAVLVAVWRIFSAGKKSAVGEMKDKALEAEHARTQVDVAVATGGDAERKRLLGKYERD